LNSIDLVIIYLLEVRKQYELSSTNSTEIFSVRYRVTPCLCVFNSKEQLMNPSHEIIYDLIARSFTSELNEDEALVLDQWKAENSRNLLEYQDLSEIWDVSGRMSLPPSSELENHLQTTRKKAGIPAAKSILLKVILQAAAVLLLALILNGLFQYFGKSPAILPKEEMVFQNVRAAFGTQSHVKLPDGTMVSLNSGSTLTFPVSFINQQYRVVQLSGEGHFEVVKNSLQPFIVKTKKLEVVVVGTIFNVESYANNPNVTVALEEGSVRLLRETENGDLEMGTMKLNDVAVFKQDGDKVSISSDNDLYKYIAWKDGKIVFSNDPVQTVIQKLSNWYNVDIVLADKKLEKYRFTGTFIDEPLEQILSILNLTSKMNYTIIPAIKLADNSYSKRKIILKSK
jgi:transmembrane sensor